jgi:Domain of unknown function (DUF5671)
VADPRLVTEPTPEQVPGRAAYVLSQLYYYVAAVVGVGLVIGGAVAILFGVRTLVLPREFEEARDGFRGMLLGAAFALPGLATLWWHLREARRREGGRPRPTFWGSSLYFHLVALIGLFFVIGGTVGVLAAVVNLVLPQCFGSGRILADCFPQQNDAARAALDAAIFVIAGGPVMWWHLRRGRRLTAPVD